MEANRLEGPVLTGLSLIISLLGAALPAAEYRTTNFVVSAPSQEIARQVAEKAEDSRRELALAWLGETLPNWYQPCPVTVQVGQIGAGGATTFTFDRGEVSGWKMRVQGTLERILDSVIPHEVSHTIFASHFRRPLPRWADEGAATLIEHPEEQKRQEVILSRVLQTSQRIPLDKLLNIAEYPRDMQQVYTLYAEGYSLSNYLVQQHGEDGRAIFLKFIQEAHQKGWQQAIRKFYNFGGVAELEKSWTTWVIAGSPSVRGDNDPRLASNETPAGSPAVATTAAASRPTQPPAASSEIAATPAAQSAPAALALASLPPLPPLQREFRQPREAGPLAAPAPGAVSEARNRDAVGRLVASGTGLRVLPRRDPPPGFGSQLPVASQQWMQQNLARSQYRRSATTMTAAVARPSTDATTLRGQSP